MIHTTPNILPAHAITDTVDMHVVVLLPFLPPSNGSHDVSPEKEGRKGSKW